MEIWKDIKGLEGKYQISNYGRVKSLERIEWKGNRWGNYAPYKKKGIFLKLKDTNWGYKRVSLKINDKVKDFAVHRLVAEYFILNPENKPFVMHLDDNGKNNHYENLRWGTAKENTRDMIDKGRVSRGESRPLARLTEGQVREIREKYIWRSIDSNCVTIAKEYGVSRRSIQKVIKRQTWKHVA